MINIFYRFYLVLFYIDGAQSGKEKYLEISSYSFFPFPKRLNPKIPFIYTAKFQRMKKFYH